MMIITSTKAVIVIAAKQLTFLPHSRLSSLIVEIKKLENNYLNTRLHRKRLGCLLIQPLYFSGQENERKKKYMSM